MSKIRLLHITSSLKRGGAEAVLFNLITHTTHQFEHIVLYVHEGPYVEQLHAHSIQTYQLKGLFFRYDPLFFWRLFWQVKCTKPDIIHSLLWAANVSTRIVARLLRIPHVSAVHNNVEQDGKFRNILDRLTLSVGGPVVAVSLEVASGVKKLCQSAAVRVIPNGIDSAVVQEKACKAQISRADLGLTAQHFVIGSVGRYEAVKNYPLLLQAFHTIYATAPHARLVLVGHGSQEEFLRTQAKKLGLEKAVIFVVGQQSYGYYPLFDCFALTSSQEGVSIALLEALSCRLPCVVTAMTRMHPVLVHGKTGMLVPAESAPELVSALKNIMKNPAWAHGIGQAGGAVVAERFALKNMVCAYEKTFVKLLNRN